MVMVMQYKNNIGSQQKTIILQYHMKPFFQNLRALCFGFKQEPSFFDSKMASHDNNNILFILITRNAVCDHSVLL